MRLTKVSPTAAISPARFFTILLALLLLPALAVACGGDDDDDAGDTADGGEAADSGDNGDDAGNDSDNMDTGDDNGSDDASSDMDDMDDEDAGQDMDDGDDAGSDDETAGTVTVGDDSWTFVPSISCSVFPGPVAYLAGHAAEDESVEITIDYDPDGDLINAQVSSADAGFNWIAGDRTLENDLEFEISDNTVTATGTFTNQVAGGESAGGTIDITC
ncbi:MAG: hypothetical protein U5Q44_02130 [Dehalococcoidia bacterium]|nr:hypothetical protein [Dehalococcoidia bacterium]